MSIWAFNTRLTRRLMQWALASAMLGLLMSTKRGFWAGMGSQFIGWAAVNLGIAWFGSTSTRRRLDTLGVEAYRPAVQIKEQAGLRRLLLINAGLDVLYMLGGLLTMRRPSARLRGVGLGIILQGAFLFVFDLYHAVKIDEDVTPHG